MKTQEGQERIEEFQGENQKLKEMIRDNKKEAEDKE
jgi:hypothetical protein